MRSGVRILATPAEGVVGDWSTASRPIIVSAGAASEGGREKNMAFEVPAAKFLRASNKERAWRAA